HHRYLHSFPTRRSSDLGDTERALALAMQAEDAAQHRKLNDFLACVQLARGFAWCSAGRHDNAFVALRRLFDPDDPAFHLRERFRSEEHTSELQSQSNLV